MPLRQAELLVRVPLYGVPGIVLYCYLTLFAPDLIIPLHFDLFTIASGILLGAGLLATGLQLSQVVFLTVFNYQRRKHRQRSAIDELAAFGNTGWVRGYTIVRRAFPVLGYVLIATSILGEELGFRGVALALLARGFPSALAILISVLGFTGIQKMNMPSWTIALIPMTSAFLMGLCHAYLALVVHNMLLLFVSHYTFFIFSTLLFSQQKRTLRYQQT